MGNQRIPDGSDGQAAPRSAHNAPAARHVRVTDAHEGIPLTRRSNYGALAMPDRITIYRRTILRHAASERSVVDMVRRTVIHEVAHHFGISDPRLRELGW